MFILYDYKLAGIIRVFKKYITNKTIFPLIILSAFLLPSCSETVTESFKPVPYVSGTILQMGSDTTQYYASIIIQNSPGIPEFILNDQELRLNRDDELLEYEGYFYLTSGDSLYMDITYDESFDKPIKISWSDIIPDPISLVDSSTIDLNEGETKTLHWSRSNNANFYYLYIDLEYYCRVNDDVTIIGVHSHRKYATDTLYTFTPDFYMPEVDNYHISQAKISVRPIAGPVPNEDLGNISGDAAGFIMVSGKSNRITISFTESSQN